MSDHLSALTLDELAVGQANEAATAHVKDCAQCRARLDAVMAANDAVSAAPDFLKRLDALEQSPDLARPVVVPFRRPWLRVAAVALPLAAALALFVFLPRGDDTRLKGQVTVELLSAAGQAVSKARPGDRVSLSVGGAGHSHATVLAVDATGEVTRVWPAGELTAPIPKGARALLEPAFEVTPGSLVLFAFFTDAPQPVVLFETVLRTHVAQEVKAGRAPLEVTSFDGPTPVARVSLEVVP